MIEEEIVESGVVMTIQSSKIVWEVLPVAPEMTTRSCDLKILMEYKTSSGDDDDDTMSEGSGINSTTELECLAQIIDVVVEEDDEAAVG